MTKEQGQIALRALNARDSLRRMLDLARDEGRIYGIGACTRATPLIHYADLEDYLTCVCEVPQSEKIGMSMPGTNIPVVDEARLIKDQPPYALLVCVALVGQHRPEAPFRRISGKVHYPPAAGKDL